MYVRTGHELSVQVHNFTEVLATTSSWEVIRQLNIGFASTELQAKLLRTLDHSFLQQTSPGLPNPMGLFTGPAPQVPTE